MKKTVLSVKNLTKTFKIPHERRDTLKEHFTQFFKGLKFSRLDALKKINIDVKEGDFLGIIGMNGSGKSTLLKVLAGIYTPSKGKVNVKGRISPFLELGVGFNADLTGRENVYLNGTILGMSKKEIDKKYDEIVEFAELGDFMDAKIKNYSSGMHVRLAFSIAIQADADVFLCDEVLAVGDMAFQQKCFDVFTRLKNEGKTIIYVSHDIASVRRFCDRCILLKKGEVVADGKTEEVIERYIYNRGEDGAKQEVEKDQDDKSHLSSKSAVIEGFKLFDKHNKPSTTFCPGDPLKLILDYRIKDKSVDKVNMGIAIYDEEGRHVFADTSAWNDVYCDKKKGMFTFLIRKIPFLSGKYFITVALANANNDKQFDWINKKISFSVYNDGVKQGIIDMDTVWNGGSVVKGGGDNITKQILKSGKEALKKTDQLITHAIFADSVEERVKKYRELGVKIGDNVYVDYGVWLEPPFPELIEIEDNVVISAFVKLIGHDSSLQNAIGFPVKKGNITLKKGCYLGNSAIVLSGVTIGESAIIGAGSVVTKSVPAGEVWAGVPAKKICSVNELLEKNIDNFDISPDLYEHLHTPYIPEKNKFFNKAIDAIEYDNDDMVDDDLIDEILNHAEIEMAKSVLDIGCGHGALCKRCFDKGVGKIKGIDYRDSVITQAEESTMLRGVFSVMDFKQLRREQGVYERVFLLSFVCCLTDWERKLLWSLLDKIVDKDGFIYVYEKEDFVNDSNFVIYKTVELKDKGKLYILHKPR